MLPLLADAGRLQSAPLRLEMSAAFFRSNRPLERIDEPYGDVYDSDRMVSFDGGGIVTKTFPSADTLYYFSTDGNLPLINLDDFPEFLSILYDGVPPFSFSAEPVEPRALSPADVDGTGIASLVVERRVELPLDESMVSHDRYNDLAEKVFRWRDITFTFGEFRMNHFSLEADLWMDMDGGVPLDADGEPDLRAYPTVEFLVDGKPVGGGCWGGIGTMDYGRTAYHAQYDAIGYIPIGEGHALELAILQWNDDFSDFTVADTVARLTPILSEELAEKEASALKTRQAAAGWQAGDENIDVYATTNGTWFHLDPACGGMRNAYKWRIADALNAGKEPCPVCVLGEEENVEDWFD